MGGSTRLLEDLHRVINDLDFPLDTPSVAELRELQQRTLTQISSHLLPRLGGAAPTLVVLGGPTGAGKSTIFNSLVGAEVSPAGVLRPTTRRAVLAHHPGADLNYLSHLADPIAADTMHSGMALVDAPDLDSREHANRTVATQLLEAADLWILVTTAARYGDRIPWQQVLSARDRGLQLAVVLNRVPDAARSAIRADLTERLARIGLGETPHFLIPDLSPHQGPLPEQHVEALRDWLQTATADRQGRGIARRTTAGTWGALRANVAELMDGAQQQRAVAAHLRAAAVDGLARPTGDVTVAIQTGQCATGAPAAFWQNSTRPGQILAPLVGLRGPGRGARRQRTATLTHLSAAVGAGITSLLADGLRDAAGTVEREWRDVARLAALPVDPPQVPSTGDGRDPKSQTAHELAENALATWWREIERIIDSSAAPASLLSLTDAPGITALVAAAAGGVPGASDAVARHLPLGVVEGAQQSLVSIAEAQIAAVAEPYLRTLRDVPEPEQLERLAALTQSLKDL